MLFNRLSQYCECFFRWTLIKKLSTSLCGRKSLLSCTDANSPCLGSSSVQLVLNQPTGSSLLPQTFPYLIRIPLEARRERHCLRLPLNGRPNWLHAASPFPNQTIYQARHSSYQLRLMARSVNRHPRAMDSKIQVL